MLNSRLKELCPANRRLKAVFYGWYSNRTRGYRKQHGLLAKVEAADPLPSPADRAPLGVRRSWARLIRQVYEVDPLLCPRCGGTMKVIAVLERPPLVRQILTHLGLPTAAPGFRAPPAPPDGLPAGPPREWSYEPKHFTAELAKIAKAHQVSTTWAQRLGQNVPVCATFFLPPFLWIWGISLRAWRALRFKCTFWDEPLFDLPVRRTQTGDLPVPDPVIV